MIKGELVLVEFAGSRGRIGCKALDQRVGMVFEGNEFPNFGRNYLVVLLELCATL